MESMKVLLAGICLVLVLSGCANRVLVPQPDGRITVHDRMISVLNSDLPPEQKAQIIQALLEREKDAGANWTSALKDYLSWLVAAGFVIAK